MHVKIIQWKYVYEIEKLINKINFSTDFASNTYNDEVCGLDMDIEETSKGFRLRMEVPNAYYKFIIGKRGETKTRLQVETQTQIHIPKPGDKQEVIGKMALFTV